MRRRHRLSAVLFGFIAVATMSCSSNDSPIAPVPAPTSAIAAHPRAAGDLLDTAITVTPLLRTSPLQAPITRSAYIGVFGGTISIPEAGLSIVIPPFALTSTKLISVTALAGSDVAYEFAPHGTTFLLPVVATQSLTGTQAGSVGSINPLSLYVGYFPDDNNILSVTELLSINIDLANQVGVFSIWHFSGYIIATGDANDGQPQN